MASPGECLPWVDRSARNSSYVGRSPDVLYQCDGCEEDNATLWNKTGYTWDCVCFPKCQLSEDAVVYWGSWYTAWNLTILLVFIWVTFYTYHVAAPTISMLRNKQKAYSKLN